MFREHARSRGATSFKEGSSLLSFRTMALYLCSGVGIVNSIVFNPRSACVRTKDQGIAFG